MAKRKPPARDEWELWVHDLAFAWTSLSRFTSKDRAKPALRGIFFEEHPDGVVMVATDLYRLGWVYLRWDGERSGDVPEQPLRSFVVHGGRVGQFLTYAATPKVPSKVKVHIHPERMVFDSGDETVTAWFSDDPFVNWRSLSSSLAPYDGPVHLNPRYVKDFCDIQLKAQPGRALKFDLGAGLNPQPFEITSTTYPTVSCLLMPVRGE